MQGQETPDGCGIHGEKLANRLRRILCAWMPCLGDLPPDARPREKLLRAGPGCAGDAELLALLLRTGLPGLSVVALAQSLLDTFGGWRGLLAASGATWARVRAWGPPNAPRSRRCWRWRGARWPVGRAAGSDLEPQAARQFLQLSWPGTGPRGVCRAVPRRAAAADPAGRDVPRHAHGHQPSTRARWPSARWSWRLGRHPGPQPSQRRGRALAAPTSC